MAPKKMPTAVSKHLALDEDDPLSYDSTDENDENDEADWALDQAAESRMVCSSRDAPQIPAEGATFEQLSRRHMWIPSCTRSLPNTLRLHVQEAPINYRVLSFFRSGDLEKICRGFVRAYAPVFLDCGIAESTFLQFLESMHMQAR